MKRILFLTVALLCASGLASDNGARERADSALSAARTAVKQSEAPPSKRAEATHQLEQAQKLFNAAQYEEAAKAADSAWQLLAGVQQPVRFEVSVDAEGATEVSAQSGKPVRVEAQGGTQVVYPGQQVKVAPGERPTPPIAPLDPPTPLLPQDGATVQQGQKKPVLLRWAAVPGAARYRVELSGEKSVSLEVEGAEGRLPALPPGNYLWTVQAVAEDGRSSPASPQLGFVLSLEPLKLEVGKSTWK